MKIFKIFTFLKESSILVTIKTQLLKLIHKNKDGIKNKLEEYTTNKYPKVKDNFINYIIDNIELPIYLKPFKKIIKKVAKKNIDKLEQFILQQIDNI